MSMLNEIKSMMDFEEYKFCLMRILLTKLMIVEKMVDYKDLLPSAVINEIISYCRSLKYFLSENNFRKYDYLFNNLSDICSNTIVALNANQNQLIYMADNLELIIGFKWDKLLDLDKFIIKMIKKTNYQAVIAEDQNDSEEISDVEIYDDNKEESDKSEDKSEEEAEDKSEEEAEDKSEDKSEEESQKNIKIKSRFQGKKRSISSKKLVIDINSMIDSGEEN
jgi:hypothetical protein